MRHLAWLALFATIIPAAPINAQTLTLRAGRLIQCTLEEPSLSSKTASFGDLLRQDAGRGYTRRHHETLQRLRDDLVYLQHRCRIVASPGVSISAPVSLTANTFPCGRLDSIS